MRGLTAGAAATVVAALTVLAAAPVRADPVPVATPADPVVTASLSLVLDASGSMADPDTSGVRRIDAAKSALRTVIAGLADQAQVGLRVYGGRDGSCTDTTRAVKVGRLDRAALSSALDTYTPKGETPIALALRGAVSDLPRSGPRTIVLVSDGASTCDPDPCPVAAQLAAASPELRIEAVGFGVDAKSRAQLTCIAQQTRGHYYDARNASDLAAQLSRVSVRAFRAYTPSGRPVSGTPSSTGAPALPSGEWVDTLAPGQTRYYTVTFPALTTPYVTATLVRPVGTFGANVSDAVQLGLETTDGVRCGSASDTRRQDDEVTPLSVTAALGPMGKKKWEYPFSSYVERGCGKPGKYALSVTRSADDAGGPDAFPLELSVLVEPPAQASGLPQPRRTVSASDSSAEPPPAPDFTTLPGRAPGGAGYTDAGTLRTGVVSDTIRAGETLFWRVPLSWGQRLSYAVRFDRTGRDSSATVGTWVANPLREYVETLAPGPSTSYYDGDSTTDLSVLRNNTVAVGYRNRDNAQNTAVRNVQVAGSYYVAVRMEDDEGLAGVDVPIQVAVTIDGERSGVPRYSAVAGAVAPRALDGIDTRAVRTDDSDFPLRTLALVAGGFAALLVAVGLVLVPVLLSRRRPPATPAG